jgi:O-antigen ligase
MGDLVPHPGSVPGDLAPRRISLPLKPRPRPAPRKRKAPGLALTSLLCFLVWAGYNTTIYYWLDPLYPKNFLNFIHGLRAFLPLLAAIVASWKLAHRPSLPIWLKHGPLALCLFYGGIGLASSFIVSVDPLGAVFWGLEYISVIIVVLAVASGPDSEAHLERYISVNWGCCAVICLGLLAGIPLLGGGALGQTAGSPLGVIAYSRPREELMGMASTRNTGFGRFAAVVFVVGLAKLLHDRKNNKTIFIWTPLMLASGLALLLAQARTSWVSVVVATLLLLARAPTRWRVPIIMITLLALPFVFLTGFGHAFFLYLTRGRGFDPTLTGRTVTWLQGWEALQQSPWVGLGFWADRFFLKGANMQSTFFAALVQAGFLGLIPLLISLIWVWVGILRHYSIKPAGETSSLPGELLGVMTFFTVYSITEITCSFYSVGWMIMAPLFAHVQLRVHQRQLFDQSVARFHFRQHLAATQERMRRAWRAGTAAEQAPAGEAGLRPRPPGPPRLTPGG